MKYSRTRKQQWGEGNSSGEKERVLEVIMPNLMARGRVTEGKDQMLEFYSTVVSSPVFFDLCLSSRQFLSPVLPIMPLYSLTRQQYLMVNSTNLLILVWPQGLPSQVMGHYLLLLCLGQLFLPITHSTSLLSQCQHMQTQGKVLGLKIYLCRQSTGKTEETDWPPWWKLIEFTKENLHTKCVLGSQKRKWIPRRLGR